MGSSGSKPRKKKKSQGNRPQHLPKVGTATETSGCCTKSSTPLPPRWAWATSSGTKTIVMGVVIFIVVIAILGLIGLNTFH